MDISTLLYDEAQDYDHLQQGSLWIRIIESDSGYKGEIIKIKYIQQFGNNKFLIKFKNQSERVNDTFSKNFIPYYGTKEAKDHDIEWLKANKDK